MIIFGPKTSSKIFSLLPAEPTEPENILTTEAELTTKSASAATEHTESAAAEHTEEPQCYMFAV